MTLDALLPILMPATFFGLLALERLVPARAQPTIPWWVAKGTAMFFVVGAINAIAPALALSALGPRTVLHTEGLGTLGGAAVLVLASDLVGYWVHRGLHTFDAVWRWTHQLHHSPERMDMAGSAWFHPLDVLAQQVLPTIGLAVLLGPSPEAAALGGFLGFVLGVTPHLNVRTPRWLGYVFQRPEMHAVHHTRGVHAYNYGGLAFSDLLFGTWRNPATFPEGEFGFWDGATSRFGAMLVGRDASRPEPRPAVSPR
jgi:sterol desaturase/sphingolipid hydroxylase (fatty acid hydroxylase superfamily)